MGHGPSTGGLRWRKSDFERKDAVLPHARRCYELFLLRFLKKQCALSAGWQKGL